MIIGILFVDYADFILVGFRYLFLIWYIGVYMFLGKKRIPMGADSFFSNAELVLDGRMMLIADKLKIIYANPC